MQHGVLSGVNSLKIRPKYFVLNKCITRAPVYYILLFFMLLKFLKKMSYYISIYVIR